MTEETTGYEAAGVGSAGGWTLPDASLALAREAFDRAQAAWHEFVSTQMQGNGVDVRGAAALLVKRYIHAASELAIEQTRAFLFATSRPEDRGAVDLGHCDHCKNLRWFFDERPHEGGDERCPKCNPECRTCWDEMQVEVPWTDDLERGPRYQPCPNCAVQAPRDPAGDFRGAARAIIEINRGALDRLGEGDPAGEGEQWELLPDSSTSHPEDYRCRRCGVVYKHDERHKHPDHARPSSPTGETACNYCDGSGVLVAPDGTSAHCACWDDVSTGETPCATCGKPESDREQHGWRDRAGMTRIAKHLFLPAVPAPPTVGPEDAVEEWERVPELDTEGGHVWQDMSDIRGLSVRVPLAVEQAIRAEAEARSDRAWKVWAESRLSANAADLRDWMQAHGEAEARATAAEAQVEGLRAALAAEVEHYDGLKTGARRRMNYDFGDIYESVADRLRALAGESTGAGEGE